MVELTIVKLQLAALNIPVPLLVKLTVPVGVVGLVEVSLTAALHELAWSTATEPGLQLTVVVVECKVVMVRIKLPELPEWVESPP